MSESINHGPAGENIDLPTPEEAVENQEDLRELEKAEAAEDIGELAVEASISESQEAVPREEIPNESPEHAQDEDEQARDADAEPPTYDEEKEVSNIPVSAIETSEPAADNDEEDPSTAPSPPTQPPPNPPVPPGGGGHGHGPQPPAPGAPGGGGGPGGPLPPDLRQQAILNHLRFEAVERAQADGFTNPIEYLVKSRRHPELAKRLERHGYDLSPPPVVRDGPRGEDVPLPDPVAAIGLHGAHIRDQIATIQRAIETEQGLDDIRDRLHRPQAKIPILGWLPLIGRKAGQIRLAYQVYKNEKSHRPNTREVKLANGDVETVPASYDNGILGLGFKHILENYHYITSLDADVTVQRSKLSDMNLHKMRGTVTEARRNLAERILLDIIKLDSLKDLHIIPEQHFYDHESYASPWKEYVESKDNLKRELERFEFIRLKTLGVLNRSEQERMNELLAKHPGWHDEAVLLKGLGVRTQAQEDRLNIILGR